MVDDWKRNSSFERQILQEAARRAQQEADAMANDARLKELRDQAEKRALELFARVPTPRWATPPPMPPRVLTEGSQPSLYLSLSQFDAQVDNLDQRVTEVGEEEIRTSRVQSTSSLQEAARMALRDALNAGVASGLFDEQRALAIIALTGINNNVFPPAEARENVRLALAQAARAKAIPARLAGEAWRQIKVQLGAESAELDLPADAERYEEILYEVLTIRPCHLAEHEEWHLRQTICAAQRVRMSADLLDELCLLPLMLPRVAHQDREGRTLECCQDAATQRWLDTGLTDSTSEV